VAGRRIRGGLRAGVGGNGSGVRVFASAIAKLNTPALGFGANGSA
jgi:hypothetical protein